MEKEKKIKEEVLKEEKVSEVKEAEEKDVSQEKKQVEATKETEAAKVVQFQAQQSQYIDKLTAIFSKDEISQEDVQNVEYCKAEILSQLLGMTSYAMQLSADDGRKVAADAVTSHLTKLYEKTAKLREEAARKKNKTIEHRDVMEAKFGSGKTDVVTDEMLQPDFKLVTLALVGAVPGLSKALSLKDLITNPTARLETLLPDLLKEFNQNTSDETKNSYQTWANLLVEGLGKLGGKNSMMNALQGKALTGMMKQLGLQQSNK